jgi:UDP-2,4-diacetamido-2,4,6-trideoxy-beta-L-altropyranose hydrolase
VSSGFELINVESAHPHPGDLAATLSHIAQMDGTWLVLDGYHFDSAYQKAIRRSSCGLLVIDDYVHQPSYHADLILNQNINAPHMQYNADPDTKLLLGPEFGLLRDQFLKQESLDRKFPSHARRVLVTMGGADPDNTTTMVLEALRQVDITNLEVTAVVGPANPHLPLVLQAAEQSPGNVRVLQDVKDMPELMAWADVAIAGGGTTWSELAFMGLPSLLLVLADNQVDVAAGMAKAGSSINLGEAGDATAATIKRAIEPVLADAGMRRHMSEDARRLVDGKGAARIVEAMANRSRADSVSI